MAGTITHHIIAKRFLNNKNYSKEFKDAFLFGTHGPDFLFFKETDEHLGHKLHILNGKELFNNYDKILLNKSDYYKGYAYGLLCHYYIDRYVHQYVGYLVKIDNYLGRHALVEAEADAALYFKEYGKNVNTFNFKDEYIINDDLINDIASFYNDLNISKNLNFSYIKECWKLMIDRTTLMLKPNPVLLLLIKIYEMLFKKGTFYSSHFFTKDKLNRRFLNDDHKEWDGAFNKDNHSFDEIIEIGLNDFINEIKIIEDSIKENKKYEFNNPINFDGEIVG